jgi:predicted dehydrogenase
VELSSLAPVAYNSWKSFEMRGLEPHQRCGVAVVGLGKQGTKLARATVDAGFDLVAVCDADATRLKAFKVDGNSVQPRKFKSIDDLRDAGADVCILATLADNHLALVKRLHGAGIRRVLCEKPVVNNMRDLVKLKELLGESGIRFAVNHIKLWSVDWEFARAVIQSGELGRLERVSVRFKSAGFGNIGSHQLAALCYLTGRKLARAKSALFEAGAGAARKNGYFDPNGLAIYELDGVAVDVDSRALPVSPANRLSFCFEGGTFELLEEFNIFRFLNYETGLDEEKLFKLPWLGSRQSWPVIVHLLRSALIEVMSQPDGAKLDSALQSVEGIIAAQLSSTRGGPVPMPLDPEVKTPFLFS